MRFLRNGIEDGFWISICDTLDQFKRERRKEWNDRKLYYSLNIETSNANLLASNANLLVGYFRKKEN